MQNERKIPALIVAGYAVVIVLVMGLGHSVMSAMVRMGSITQDLYRHPFTVSNAALELKADIFEIRNRMVEIVVIHGRGTAPAPQLLREIDEFDGRVKSSLAIVKSGFLGDMSRVVDLERRLAAWKVVRAEILRLEFGGAGAEAERMVREVGTPMFDQMVPQVDYVISFARHRAAAFVEESNSEAASRLLYLKWLLAGLIAIILVTMVFVISRIRAGLANSKRAMRELQQSEQRFRDILEFAPIGTGIASASDGRIIQANQALCDLLGYSEPELKQLTILDITHPEDTTASAAYWGRLTRGEARTVRTEKRYLRKDGQALYANTTISSYADSQRRQYLIAQIENITERKEFEAQLRASAREFRLLFESASDCLLILSLDGRIVDINQVGHERLGYAKEEMLGRPIAQFDSPEFADKVMERVAQVMNGGHATFESAHLRKNGTVMPVEISSKLVELGGTQRIFSIIRDITERKAAEQALRASEAQYRAVIETSADGFWFVNMEGRLLEVNDAYVHLSGYSREELLQMRIADLEAAEKPEETAAHIAKVMRDGHDRFETYHRAKDGRILPVEIVTNYWPSIGRLFVFIVDIAERKKATEHINLLAKVFENGVEAMLITDADNKITDVNRAFTQLTGYSHADVIGKNPSILASGAQSRQFYEEMWRTLLETDSWQGEVVDRRKDGSLYPKWLAISTVRNAQGQIVNYIASFTDITERKRAENEIRHLAYHDTLTGLHNRFSLVAGLEQDLALAHRNQTMVALMFIDLDRFKNINDTLGHHVGDGILVQVAERLRGVVRESDIVARLGGDEFVVALNDVRHADEAALVASKIIADVSRPYDIEGHKLYTSPSVGISIYPDDGADVGSVMQSADTAMYYAKTRGGGNFSFFDSAMNDEATERMRIESGLREALELGQFELYYQPQIELDGQVRGVEALIRWNHPERGLVMPDSFIGIAEDTGLILPIGRWVLETACRQLRKFADMGLPVKHMAINLSAREFLQESFAETVIGIIADAGVRPEQIELEITENTAMDNSEQVVGVMNALKAIKVRLAMDDFGTGYSSLSYLRVFPIDKLKIDRSFIRNIEGSPDDLAITVSTIDLAHKLGIEVVAEGVDNQRQSEILVAHGCDLRQGFLFSKPLRAADLAAFLEKVSLQVLGA